MKVNITKSGNILSADLELTPNKLNLKLGMNGIGKTTIAKSIFYEISKDSRMNELITYGSKEMPVVKIPSEIKSCMYFNIDYVDNYLFKEDILHNSYEIIVKTANFEETKNLVERKIIKLVNLSNQPLMQKFVKDVADFNNEIEFKSDGSLNLTKKIAKGLKDGNFEQYISEEINRYRKYITGAKNSEWSSWFSNGNNFIRDNECPFCTEQLRQSFASEKEEIEKSLSSTRIKDNMYSKDKLNNISLYSTQNQKQILLSVCEMKQTPTADQGTKIKAIRDYLLNEKIKLDALSKLSPISLIDDLLNGSIKETISSLKLDISFFENINNDYKQTSTQINNTIGEIITMTDDLKVDLGKLNSELSKNIKNAKKFINEFLDQAGIPYKVDIIKIADTQFKTILKPKSIDMEVPNPKDKLSFGEKNAVSLILFCVETNSKNIDLIILDDPVSSFDNNKKYAIIHQLFKCREHMNFFGKTVLMFTHDLTPIIDFVMNGKPNKECCVPTHLTFLKGNMTEIEITQDHLKNSIIFENENSKNEKLNIISRILHLRRYFELVGDIVSGEYDVISSLLHLKSTPEVKINEEEFKSFDPIVLERSMTQIQKFITDFDYKKIFDSLNNDEYLKTIYASATPTERLHITRIYIEKNKEKKDNVLWKFICETYHIENEFVISLDPYKHNQVPEYIELMCDEIIGN